MALTILKKGLYQLTEGDKAIINSAIRNNNPNIITNYYMRNEDSGTYWRHVEDRTINRLRLKQSQAVARKWQLGWDKLENMWNSLGKPDYFGPNPDTKVWQAWRENEYQRRYESLDLVYRLQWGAETGLPEFHHPHGVQFLPWQLKMHQDKSPLQVVIGGFGSSKTYGKVLSYLVRGILLRGYRAFALAPQSKQSDEVHKVATGIIEGTKFEQFVYGMPFRPNPSIQMGHNGVGRTLIECMPMIDDPKKIRTLTGDEAMVDQAEEFPDLSEMVRSVGTRFRGQVRGRPRRGQLSFIANAGDNPQLWDYFDDAEEDEDIWAYAPATFENLYLTVDNLLVFEKRVGENPEDLDIYLLGKRPLGNGEHFSVDTLKKTKSADLDLRMSNALEAREPGWVIKTAKKVAQHTWERPPEPDRVYCVACDPGYGNPPERNSAVIGVFDVTDFPRMPAQLAAFNWVYGNNSPNPWIAKYSEYVVKYNSLSLNGYDSTGPSGAGYDRLEGFKDLLAAAVGLQGQKKFMNLNLLKKIMADGKIHMPSIEHVFSQLSKYRLPDDKLRQDIVSMLIVFAALVEPLMIANLTADEIPEDLLTENEDRWGRPVDQFDGERTER